MQNNNNDVVNVVVSVAVVVVVVVVGVVVVVVGWQSEYCVRGLLCASVWKFLIPPHAHT